MLHAVFQRNVYLILTSHVCVQVKATYKPVSIVVVPSVPHRIKDGTHQRTSAVMCPVPREIGCHDQAQKIACVKEIGNRARVLLRSGTSAFHNPREVSSSSRRTIGEGAHVRLTSSTKKPSNQQLSPLTAQSLNGYIPVTLGTIMGSSCTRTDPREFSSSCSPPLDMPTLTRKSPQASTTKQPKRRRQSYQRTQRKCGSKDQMLVSDMHCSIQPKKRKKGELTSKIIHKGREDNGSSSNKIKNQSKSNYSPTLLRAHSAMYRSGRGDVELCMGPEITTRDQSHQHQRQECNGNSLSGDLSPRGGSYSPGIPSSQPSEHTPDNQILASPLVPPPLSSKLRVELWPKPYKKPKRLRFDQLKDPSFDAGGVMAKESCAWDVDQPTHVTKPRQSPADGTIAQGVKMQGFPIIAEMTTLKDVEGSAWQKSGLLDGEMEFSGDELLFGFGPHFTDFEAAASDQTKKVGPNDCAMRQNM